MKLERHPVKWYSILDDAVTKIYQTNSSILEGVLADSTFKRRQWWVVENLPWIFSPQFPIP